MFRLGGIAKRKAALEEFIITAVECRYSIGQLDDE
jgi:hypothetical protein